MDNTKPKKNKHVLSGTVMAKRDDKTVMVEVINSFRHPLYRKAVKKTKRYAVHNILKDIAVGDSVRIVETRPISKTKHFQVLEKFTK